MSSMLVRVLVVGLGMIALTSSVTAQVPCHDPAQTATFLPNQPLIHVDAVDAEVRRSDPNGAIWPLGAPPPMELLSLAIGPWAPADAAVDLYVGSFDDQGGFLRLDLRLDGVVNPPGLILAQPNPTQFGLNPLFGYVEFDVDRNADTGGEIDLPELRYNATVGRFGGVPRGAWFTDRISMDGADWPGTVDAVPAIHRSGEEFHLALFGDFNVEPSPITTVVGDGDLVFESGEVWLVKGFFFHRAHAYENLTFAGDYAPLVELRYAHDIDSDVTTVSLVYPLTNAAYAATRNANPEDEDIFDDNANSIREALGHVVLSATIDWVVGDPFWPLIEQWGGASVDDHLDPRLWRPTALLGTAFVESGVGGRFDYTDVWPNVVIGDFNADGLATNSDAQMATEYVQVHDNDPAVDAEINVMPDGAIAIMDFGVRFHVFDVDYDGRIDALDTGYSLQDPGDFDNNGSVGLRDYAALQRCFGLSGDDAGEVCNVGCFDAFDLDQDGAIGPDDVGLFIAAMTGR